MTNAQLYLLIVFGAALASFLGYEGYALLTKHTTISEYVWAANRTYPIIGVLFGLATGMLIGHFFWQRVP
jgi:hypothetical protein